MKIKLKRKHHAKFYSEIHVFGKHVLFVRSRKLNIRKSIKGNVSDECKKTRWLGFGDKFITFSIGYKNEGISSHVRISRCRRLKHTS